MHKEYFSPLSRIQIDDNDRCVHVDRCAVLVWLPSKEHVKRVNCVYRDAITKYIKDRHELLCSTNAMSLL
jgi:hypothetical protein